LINGRTISSVLVLSVPGECCFRGACIFKHWIISACYCSFYP